MKRLGLIAAAAGAVFLFTLHQDVGAAPSNASDSYKQLDLFGDVFELVRADYVDDVSDETLIEGAINGMLTSLDPHSNYLNSKNFNDMKVQTRGEFGGLGIEVSMENGLVKVVSPIDDTPAAHAGLKPFDVKLTRAIIKIQSVRSHLEGNNIGYIRLTSFNEQTDVGLNNAMKNLK